MLEVLLVILLIPVMVLPMFWLALFLLTLRDRFRFKPNTDYVEPTPEELEAEGWHVNPLRGFWWYVFLFFAWPIFLIPEPRKRGT